DRRSLSSLDASRAGPGTAIGFVPPRDDVERRLARIWEDLFDVRRVGLTDDFFGLGGHSLLAVRLIACIEKQFGQRIPLAVLFQDATLEGLAAVLRGRTRPHQASPLVPIHPSGSKRPFFCVHGAGGGVIDYVHLARRLG